MSKWFVENQIGLNNAICFKTKQVNNNKYRHKCTEKECCKITITSISSSYGKLMVKGCIQNENVYIPVDLDNKNYVYLHSCYDTLHIFLYTLDEPLKVFTVALKPCGQWGDKEIYANIIGFFGDPYFIETGEEKIKILTNVEKLKNRYHYGNNTTEMVAPKETKSFYVLNFFNKYFKVKNNSCIFCFKEYNTLEDLSNHINLCHLHFKSEVMNADESISENILTDEESATKMLRIEGILVEVDLCKEFTFINKRYKGRNAQFTKQIDKEAETKFKKLESIKVKGKTYEIFWHKNYLIKVEDYKLDNMTQIEKEYEIIDYNEALTNHLNQRMSNFQIKKDGTVEIMELWNKLKIERYKIAETKSECVCELLYAVLKKFGLDIHTLRFIEMLYTQGVLTSVHIIQVLNRYEMYGHE